MDTAQEEAVRWRKEVSAPEGNGTESEAQGAREQEGLEWIRLARRLGSQRQEQQMQQGQQQQRGGEGSPHHTQNTSKCSGRDNNRSRPRLAGDGCGGREVAPVKTPESKAPGGQLAARESVGGLAIEVEGNGKAQGREDVTLTGQRTSEGGKRQEQGPKPVVVLEHRQGESLRNYTRRQERPHLWWRGWVMLLVLRTL